MTNRTKAIAAGGLLIAAGAWYLFRPELLFVDRIVSEAPPTANTTTAPMLTGMFHDGAHETKGVATIQTLDGGQRVLRLTGFSTSNGPDVRILLVAAADARDDATVKNTDYVDLGALKGNIGDQSYEIPTDVDLGRYRAVTVWCRRFSVNFGTAPIMAPGMRTASAQ